MVLLPGNRMASEFTYGVARDGGVQFYPGNTAKLASMTPDKISLANENSTGMLREFSGSFLNSASKSPKKIQCRGPRKSEMGSESSRAPGSSEVLSLFPALLGAALQEIVHPQFPADLVDGLACLLGAHRGRPRDELQGLRVEPAEQSDHLCRQPVAQVFLLRVAADVGERQHGQPVRAAAAR
jgi:hypothetical protein